jgi:8-oxo-dGTP diphosphatase
MDSPKNDKTQEPLAYVLKDANGGEVEVSYGELLKAGLVDSSRLAEANRKLEAAEKRIRELEIYPKPDLTTDNVIVHRNDLLLIRRKKDPFKGQWALPGGYVNKGEEPIKAAARELLEETGLVAPDLRLIGVYGKEGRDPRGWVVSSAFFGQANGRSIQAGDDAAEAAWISLDDVDTMELAFDHSQIVRDAIEAGMI